MSKTEPALRVVLDAASRQVGEPAGQGGSEAVSSATFLLMAAERSSSLNFGQYVFFLHLSSPPIPQLLKRALLLLSGKVLFSFVAHRTGEEALHIWYFVPDIFSTPLISFQICFLVLKALQSKGWRSDAGGMREKEPSLLIFFCLYVSLTK